MSLRQIGVLLAILGVSACPSDAHAHPIGFAVLAIEEGAPRTYGVVLRVSGSETDPGNVLVTWPSDCTERNVWSSAVDEVRERRSTVTCAQSLAGRTLTVDGPRRGIELLVEARLAGGTRSRIARRSLPAEIAIHHPHASDSLLAAHFLLGLEHFALGFDHVLFVVGAFFLARQRGLRALLAVITAFTIGHALTLGCATLGWIVLAPRPVEACIALSLVHVARELRLNTETLTRKRPAIVCGLFGLVHGAGFARALGDAGLAGNDLLTGLFSFNVGLEVAQLGLVLLCAAVFRAENVRRAGPLAALVVGGVGAFFFIDRTLALVSSSGP